MKTRGSLRAAAPKVSGQKGSCTLLSYNAWFGEGDREEMENEALELPGREKVSPSKLGAKP